MHSAYRKIIIIGMDYNIKLVSLVRVFDLAKDIRQLLLLLLPSCVQFSTPEGRLFEPTALSAIGIVCISELPHEVK